MKRSIIVGIAACLALAAATASGQIVTFDDTAPPNDATSYGGDPVTFGAFTFTATGGTSQFSLDPGYDNSNAPPNGTDFETFEGGTPTWTMSSAGTFALTSFRAAAIYDDPAGTLTVTGNLSGGGTVVQVFNIPSGDPNAQWATYALNPGFANLTSVDFDWSGTYVGIDDVVANAAVLLTPGVPVPATSAYGTAALALSLLGASVLALRRRRARTGR